MAWDPDRYLRFADHRRRPALELAARIPDISPGIVVDLGCGTGEVTSLLSHRWPDARIVGLDSSAEMIGRARALDVPVEWVEADIARWTPEHPVDVIFSNAALHWLGGHESLFRRLRSHLAPGGVLAVQMPNNWSEPSHRIPAGILDDPGFGDAARVALMRDRLSAPADYARWVQPADVDLWETVYHQRLEGLDPVWTWVTGSVLRPVLDVLTDDDRRRLESECRRAYAGAYPPGPDGVTTLPFRRMFLVARAP